MSSDVSQFQAHFNLLSLVFIFNLTSSITRQHQQQRQHPRLPLCTSKCQHCDAEGHGLAVRLLDGAQQTSTSSVLYASTSPTHLFDATTMVLTWGVVGCCWQRRERERTRLKFSVRSGLDTDPHLRPRRRLHLRLSPAPDQAEAHLPAAHVPRSSSGAVSTPLLHLQLAPSVRLTPSNSQKTPKPAQSKLGWFSDFLHISDDYVLNHHSIDAYFYLRFFRTLIIICLIGWPFTWAVLLPLYATSHAGQKQFDRISYSNISLPVDANRLYGVNFVGWVFLGMLCHL